MRPRRRASDAREAHGAAAVAAAAGEGSGRLPTGLRLDRVSVTLGDRQVLREVSVEVDVPRLAVIGANGSGKSTFARLLNGLVSPSSGTVSVGGLDAAADRVEIRRRVGFIFSSPDAQILMPTAAEDVALSLRDAELDPEEKKRRVAEVLTEYGLSAHADAPAYALSGGQKQLLALAAVLVTRPSLIVADEPTTLLDLGNARRIGDLLLKEVPAHTVLVTHDLELAARCDRALLFAGGRLRAVGEPHEVIEEYRRMFA